MSSTSSSSKVRPPSSGEREAHGSRDTADGRRPPRLAARDCGPTARAKRAGLGSSSLLGAQAKLSGLLRSVGDADMRFVYLAGDRALIEKRMATRRGHFMPPSLLESQFSILQEPSPDEGAWVCDTSDAPDAIVAGSGDPRGLELA